MHISLGKTVFARLNRPDNRHGMVVFEIRHVVDLTVKDTILSEPCKPFIQFLPGHGKIYGRRKARQVFAVFTVEKLDLLSVPPQQAHCLRHGFIGVVMPGVQGAAGMCDDTVRFLFPQIVC